MGQNICIPTEPESIESRACAISATPALGLLVGIEFRRSAVTLASGYLLAIRIGLCGQHSKHDGYIIDEVRQKSDPHIDRCWSIIVTHCRTDEHCFVDEPKPTPHSTGFSKKMSTSSVASQFLQKILQGAASLILAANTHSSVVTLPIRSLAFWRNFM